MAGLPVIGPACSTTPKSPGGISSLTAASRRLATDCRAGWGVLCRAGPVRRRNFWRWRVQYEAIARAMGCGGIRVEDPETLSGALRRGMEERDRPTVIDVVVAAAQPVHGAGCVVFQDEVGGGHQPVE